MRRARRSRLDCVKLTQKSQQLAGYVYETRVINPVVIRESTNNPVRYKQCWGILEHLPNNRNEVIRDIYIDESAVDLIKATIKLLQVAYKQQ